MRFKMLLLGSLAAVSMSIGAAHAGTCTTGAGNSGAPPKADSDGWAMVNVCAGGGGGGAVTQGTTPWVDDVHYFGGVQVSLGQKVMASSMPVTIASDQSAVPVSAASLPLPAGAATSTLQSVIQGLTTPATSPASGGLILGKYQDTPSTQTDGQTQAVETTNRGTLKTASDYGAPTNCGATTSATAGTVTTLITAGLAKQHIMIQNNGTAGILFSFTATTSLTATGATPNAFTLAAAQTWTSPTTYTPNTALSATSATAFAEPISCEYQ